jgi:AAA15 family ATPase/GTPase
MLEKVSISNFKVLKYLENVNFNKITLISGKNNAGKSTLLEALFLYMDIKNPDVFTNLLSWRGLKRIRLEPENLWAPFFPYFKLTDNIEIGVSMAGSNRKLQITYDDNYTPPIPIPLNNNGYITPGFASSSGFKTLSWRHETNGNSDFCAHRLLSSSSINYYVEYDKSDLLYPVYFMGPTMLDAPDNPELLGRLDKKDEQDKILPILRIFEPKLVRFQLIRNGDQDVIYADLGNKRKIPVDFFGSGFCRCLSIALILAAGGKEVLFIDEIENGIHHSLLSEFWQFLLNASNVYKCQIIATTHSYEMIEAFYEASKKNKIKDVSYIRLSKKEDVVSAHQVSFDELAYALSTNFEVR